MPANDAATPRPNRQTRMASARSLFGRTKPHTPAVLINAPRKLVDSTTAVRIPRRGGLSAKQFLRYVEDNYFMLRNTSFWAMYKGVNNERGFNDVNPCIASFPRATDYARGRNVLWQWRNDMVYGVYEMNDEYREVMIVK